MIGAEATAGIGTRETAVHAIRSAVRLVKRRTAKPGLSAIIGIAGALVASLLFPKLGIRIGTGLVSEIIYSAIGAVILLVLIRIIRTGT